MYVCKYAYIRTHTLPARLYCIHMSEGEQAFVIIFLAEASAVQIGSVLLAQSLFSWSQRLESLGALFWVHML